MNKTVGVLAVIGCMTASRAAAGGFENLSQNAELMLAAANHSAGIVVGPDCTDPHIAARNAQECGAKLRAQAAALAERARMEAERERARREVPNIVPEFTKLIARGNPEVLVQMKANGLRVSFEDGSLQGYVGCDEWLELLSKAQINDSLFEFRGLYGTRLRGMRDGSILLYKPLAPHDAASFSTYDNEFILDSPAYMKRGMVDSALAAATASIAAAPRKECPGGSASSSAGSAGSSGPRDSGIDMGAQWAPSSPNGFPTSPQYSERRPPSIEAPDGRSLPISPGGWVDNPNGGPAGYVSGGQIIFNNGTSCTINGNRCD